MAFTAGEIASIANASLDYYFNKGGQFDQSIQNKPLLNLLEGRKKTFPGGKGNISLAVVGTYGDGSGNDVVKGYTHNDAVGFFTPANIKRANYPWREHHIGLTLTHTELKIDGISVVDTNGERTAEHSKRELTVLVNLLEQKLFSLGEQYARTMNVLMWGDGTTDAKALAGVRSIIKDNPCVGVVGGLDQTAATGFTWWRNRAHTAAMATQIGTTPGDAISGGGPITSNPANGGALLAGAPARVLPAYPLWRQADDCAGGFGVHRRVDDRAPGERLLQHDRLLAVAGHLFGRHHPARRDQGAVRPDARRLGLFQAACTGSTRRPSS